MQFLSVLIGKFVITLIRIVLKRNASTWPGHIALSSNKNFIRQILNKNPHLKIVLIAGTNGKTTTTKAFSHILEKDGVSYITNASGANLLNGLASTLIKHASLFGKIKQDALLFEVDENSLPLVLGEVKSPAAVILLNLFRDQLDRYGEINITAEKWKTSIAKISKKTLVIANADDPQIANITISASFNSEFYSINDSLKSEKTLSHAVDSTVCPKCRNNLTFSKISYSHLGNYKCPKCSFSNPTAYSITLNTKLMGVFNIYNLTAAILAAKKIFAISDQKASVYLSGFTPAFGRQEIIEIDGKKVLLLLSKNPTGFNESLKVIMDNKYKCVLILLNDRIPDGRDISWIWDVDFETLPESIDIFVGGDRVYDLANRLVYADKTITAKDNLKDVLNIALDKTKNGETLAILPTYSAMLDVRKLLTGRKIL